MNKYNINSQKLCFVSCTILLTIFFFNEINYIGLVSFFNIGYPASRFVVDKNIFFIACPLAICVTLCLSKLYKNDLNKLILALIGYGIFCIAMYIVLGHLKLFKSIIGVSSFGIIPILLFLPAFSIYNCAINFKYTKYILLVSALFVAILPAFIGNHLNSESYFQPDLFKSLTTKEKKVSIEFTLKNPQEITTLNKRIINIYGLGFNKKTTPFIIDNLHENQSKIIVGIGNDLSSYCFFLKITVFEDANKLNNCIDDLSMDSRQTIFAKRDYIDTMPAFNQKIQDKYIEKIDEFLGNKNKWDIGGNENFLKLMLVRGGVFHHYDSIIDGINDVGLMAFYNQYGLGPIFLVKVIGKMFHLTIFDSVFYSIIVTNIIVLLVIVLCFGLDLAILFGYIASILSVFLVSNDIAPFLYFIRFLPVTLLSLMYAKFGIPAFKLSAQFLIECLLLLLIGIYSKEYALFTAAVIILTGVFSKEYKYCMRALFILVPLVLCLVIIPSAHVSGANFVALLSGVGFDGTPKPDTLFVFSLLFFLFSYMVYHSVHDKQILFILLLIGVFSYKYITNTSLNHFGPLFLYVFLIVYLLKQSRYCKEKYALFFPYFCTLVLLSIAMPNLNTLYHEEKFKGIEYESNNISHRFYIDNSLINLGISLDNLGVEDYCVISQQDDFLKIYSQKYITSNLPNLSTNINFPIDAYNALDSYKNCNHLIIENSLLNNELEDFLLRSIYNRDNNINRYIQGYIYNRNILKTFSKMAISNRRYAFSNKEYTVYQ